MSRFRSSLTRVRVAAAGVSAYLGVHLGHQRAGRVDHLQVPFGGLGVHLRRHPVRGQDHPGVRRHLGQLQHEPSAALLQFQGHVEIRPARQQEYEAVGDLTVAAYAAEADRLIAEAIMSADLERPDNPLLDRAQALWAILEHEEMHQETLAYMWHQLPWWPEWHRETLGYIENYLAGPKCFGGAAKPN